MGDEMAFGKVEKVTNLSQARLYLNLALTLKNHQYVDAVVDYFMRNSTECPIGEYLSIASIYLKYGRYDKAKLIIRDVLNTIKDAPDRKI